MYYQDKILCIFFLRMGASRSYVFPFKQDTTPKSAPVLAGGSVTRTCSPVTVCAPTGP